MVRLIELLQEKRTALITRTVTRGLDLNAPMKDSGVEWLGEIPAHWEVKRLKYLVGKIGSGKTPRGGAERYVDDGDTHCFEVRTCISASCSLPMFNCVHCKLIRMLRRRVAELGKAIRSAEYHRGNAIWQKLCSSARGH